MSGRAEAEDFASRFGRLHPPVDTYLAEDAEVAIVTVGTADGAARLSGRGLARAGVGGGLSSVGPESGRFRARAC